MSITNETNPVRLHSRAFDIGGKGRADSPNLWMNITPLMQKNRE